MIWLIPKLRDNKQAVSTTEVQLRARDQKERLENLVTSKFYLCFMQDLSVNGSGKEQFNLI